MSILSFDSEWAKLLFDVGSNYWLYFYSWVFDMVRRWSDVLRGSLVLMWARFWHRLVCGPEYSWRRRSSWLFVLNNWTWVQWSVDCDCGSYSRRDIAVVSRRRSVSMIDDRFLRRFLPGRIRVWRLCVFFVYWVILYSIYSENCESYWSYWELLRVLDVKLTFCCQ